MRNFFPYDCEIPGIGQIEGSYCAELGDVIEVTLPDGEVVEIDFYNGPKHTDDIVRAVASRVVSYLKQSSRHKHQIHETRFPEPRVA